MALGSAILAALHFLALGVGLGAIYTRGRMLRRLRSAPGDIGHVKAVLVADAFWGAAAVLWIVSGLLRAFAGFEKGSHYYLHNWMFWAKMGLFVVVLLLEVWPMVTFIQWRIAVGKMPNGSVPRDTPLSALVRINDVELMITIAMVFVASLMARGIGYAIR